MDILLLTERKMLRGIKEYLTGRWYENSPIAKAYAEAFDTLKEDDFSTPLHKKILQSLKSLGLRGVENIDEQIEKTYGEEGKRIVSTAGYPEAAETVRKFTGRLKGS